MGSAAEGVTDVSEFEVFCLLGVLFGDASALEAVNLLRRLATPPFIICEGCAEAALGPAF